MSDIRCNPTLCTYVFLLTISSLCTGPQHEQARAPDLRALYQGLQESAPAAGARPERASRNLVLL